MKTQVVLKNKTINKRYVKQKLIVTKVYSEQAIEYARTDYTRTDDNKSVLKR